MVVNELTHEKKITQSSFPTVLSITALTYALNKTVAVINTVNVMHTTTICSHCDCSSTSAVTLCVQVILTVDEVPAVLADLSV